MTGMDKEEILRKLESGAIRWVSSEKTRLVLRLDTPLGHPIVDLECDVNLRWRRATCKIIKDDIETGTISFTGHEFDELLGAALLKTIEETSM